MFYHIGSSSVDIWHALALPHPINAIFKFINKIVRYELRDSRSLIHCNLIYKPSISVKLIQTRNRTTQVILLLCTSWHKTLAEVPESSEQEHQ